GVPFRAAEIRVLPSDTRGTTRWLRPERDVSQPGGLLPGDGYTRAVPMSPFLVTRAARSASASSPVPSGRAGSTMYLASDVESQTVISVSGGRVTPNSASTARGSRTVRDR